MFFILSWFIGVSSKILSKSWELIIQLQPTSLWAYTRLSFGITCNPVDPVAGTFGNTWQPQQGSSTFSGTRSFSNRRQWSPEILSASTCKWDSPRILLFASQGLIVRSSCMWHLLQWVLFQPEQVSDPRNDFQAIVTFLWYYSAQTHRCFSRIGHASLPLASWLCSLWRYCIARQHI